MRETSWFALLSLHHREPFIFGGFEAKYAAAFPRKAKSLSCSLTCRRSRTSSARSAVLNGSSLVPDSASILRRSLRTQVLRELSRTESSRATSRTVRSESMTRCAASVLNSRVNFHLVTAMGDILALRG